MRLSNLTCGALYRLDFPNRKSYVGVAGKRDRDPQESAKRRYRGHAQAVVNGSSCLVHKAWRKYGAPKLTVLAIVGDQELLPSEQRAIKIYNTMQPHGYNMTPGGEVSPTTVPEIAARVGVKMLGNKHGLGYKHTPETRAQISANRSGISPPMPEGWRKSLSVAMTGNQHLLGHVHSAETRAKMSRVSKGKPKTPEHIAAMTAGMRGVKHPNNTGENHHLYGKKRPVTTCAKISSYRAFVQAIKLDVPFSPVVYERRP